MKILFIHQNFPGQFRHLVAYLAQQPGYEVVCIGQREAETLQGTQYIRYRPKRLPAKSTHHYLLGMEAGVLAGQAVLEVLLRLGKQGFVPDVIVAHPGWGESLYAKLAFPQAKLVHYCEYYYQSRGADAGFDPAMPMSMDQHARLLSRNGLHLLNLQHCDLGVSPTHWQKSVHPPAYQSRIEVIHEGVDLALAHPDPQARFLLTDGRYLSSGDKVITYVARNLEPYRGFPQFLQALAQVQAADPEVHALIIGADGVSYGKPPQGAASWREQLVPALGLDLSRAHFLGALPHARYLQALQVSTVHVYLTYPFVLSWSLLEAMACGCHVIASDTAPVREVIKDGRNGQLVDFFDVNALAQAVLAAINKPEAASQLRTAAIDTVSQRYSASVGSAQWHALLQRLHQPYLYTQSQ